MNKKEALQILAVLRASYPSEYMNLSAEGAQGVVGVWSLQFADVPVDIVLMALNKAVSVSHKTPSIAEVKEKISSVHWEAYEMLHRHRNVKPLSDEEVAHYKRVYELTERYKFKKMPEPSISNMLSGKKEVKQLGERNEQR